MHSGERFVDPRSATRKTLTLYGGLMLLTVVAGLGVRYAPLGLPWAVRKYGGSMLWAGMLYWVVCVLLPWREAVPVALVSIVTATVLELSRLWRWAPLDRFRETLPGVLLLGKYFSVRNIVAYWLAIGLVAWLDAAWVRRRSLRAAS